MGPQDHHGPVVAERGQWRVIECARCGFRHLRPYPDQDALETFYSEAFYQKAAADYIARHQEDRDWWRLEYAERYAVFAQHLPADAPRTLLDVGSGPGFFLQAGQDLGWTGTGVEPSKAAWRFSTETLGLTIHNGFFGPALSETLGRFAVIHMNNVLEHIIDPRALLETAVAHLEDGGLVCVTVPNDFNPLQCIARDRLDLEPWWVAPEQHMNYFDAESLSALLARCGLTPVYRTASFPMELFLLMGDMYVGDGALGRQLHGKRKTFEHHLHAAGAGALKRRLYDALADLGLGRHITIMGRKEP